MRGVQLAVVPEPVGLRLALRALAEESPCRAAELLVHPDAVAAHLWGRWGTPLEQAGLSRQAFLDILAAYEPELWHWLWGDRTWAQCSQGLAGRLVRRADRRSPNLPASAPRPPALTTGGHDG